MEMAHEGRMIRIKTLISEKENLVLQANSLNGIRDIYTSLLEELELYNNSRDDADYNTLCRICRQRYEHSILNAEVLMVEEIDMVINVQKRISSIENCIIGNIINAVDMKEEARILLNFANQLFGPLSRFKIRIDEIEKEI